MSYNPAKFCIKVGDKIPLNEKPSDFPEDHLVVTDVFNPSHCNDGFVKCGSVVFDIAGSTWGVTVRNGQRYDVDFKRELMAGWDYDAEDSSNNDWPDFAEVHTAFMRVPERHRSAAIEYLRRLAEWSVG